MSVSHSLSISSPEFIPNSAWELQSIDYQSAQAPQLFCQSLSQTGFAVIRNHPIDYGLIKKVLSDWQNFFAQAEDVKRRDFFSQENYSLGFYPFGSENAKGYTAKNLMEYYHYTPQGTLPEGMGPETTQLYQYLWEMGRHLLNWLDMTIDSSLKASLSRPLIEMATDKAPHTLMRFIHYPPLTDIETMEGAFRSAPHEDVNLLTLLCAATAPGLQVKDRQGNWHAVGANVEEIIVNVADMLQLATRGFFPSTTHKVVNPEGEQGRHARYSMPMFISCKPDVVLSDTVTAAQYYRQRMQETGIIKKP